MIAISEELKQAVKDSKDNLVRLVDPETKAEYVVLSVETFNQMQEKLYDDGPLTPEERHSLLVQAGLRAGWDDPEMDVYNELDPRRENESSTAEYVVLSAETFAQMQEGLFYDDSPLTEEEQTALLVELGLSMGWDDPEMDVYNELDPRRDNESSTR